MNWFVLQLGGSVLALGAFAFALTWWQSARFERRWHSPRDRGADRRP